MRRLSKRDLERLAERGIPAEEAERQLRLLAEPPPPARLERPATVGDGILRLSPARRQELEERGREARDQGRLTKFVPASGAASRMFRSLIAARERFPGAALSELERAAAGGDAAARDAVDFVAALPKLALALHLSAIAGVADSDLAGAGRSRPVESLLAALLDPSGLDGAQLPKALLPFHAARRGTRTAFVEHLVEGLGYLAGQRGEAAYHFTIPPGWRARFEAELEAARAEIDGALDVRFSEQSPATDTLALDRSGDPARTAEGDLILRPAGHGALLRNLEATRGDLVVVKNIDNVLPEARHPEIASWKLVLAGLLCELEERSPDRARPIRVCGVVPNTGEPGGGPFWVRDSSGSVALQIVESSQVEHAAPDQGERWRASTHFNPVDLVVALRDAAGTPFELERFVDPSTAFVTRRSEGGRELVVLERPGLWNGAMADWETHFVEVPGWTFAPVKTVLDLARPEHARS